MSSIVTGVDVFSPSERDRLLQAMAAMCSEQGYHRASVEGIVERAGLDRERFERYFDSKEDCALAALNQIVSETLAAVATARPAESEPERRVFQIKTVLDLMSARPDFAHLGFVEARQTGTKRMRDAYRSPVDVLALMTERVSEAGGRPPQAARAALGGLEAVVRRELVRGNRDDLSRHLPDFVYAALVPFVGQREALRQSRAAAKLLTEEE